MKRVSTSFPSPFVVKISLWLGIFALLIGTFLLPKIIPLKKTERIENKIADSSAWDGDVLWKEEVTSKTPRKPLGPSPSSRAKAAAPRNLSVQQKKELLVFGAIAMGLKKEVGDVKQIPADDGIQEVVATGINLNGYPCAKIVSVLPLQIKSTYEVTCILHIGAGQPKSPISLMH